jgi:translation initiation factor IF-1
MYKFLFFLSLFLFFISCSSERPAEVSTQKPSEVGKRSSYSLDITPLDATRNSILILISEGFNLPDAEIEWFVNGYMVEPVLPNQFKATETKKGDKVQAVAWIDGQKIESNIIQIANSPPEISKIRILPEVFKPGDTLYVEVSASDLDRDDVTITYEWTKNGEPAGNNRAIGAPLKRGDKVSVKIIPFDGEAHGRPVVLHREIVNMPPMIIEDKNYNFEGSIYTYQVKATDPDGDPLTYSLKKAPADMTMDSKTGLINWNVPPEFKGTVPITVYVADGRGGEAMQSFTLEITPKIR